jgi:hypothetical protein
MRELGGKYLALLVYVAAFLIGGTRRHGITTDQRAKLHPICNM